MRAMMIYVLVLYDIGSNVFNVAVVAVVTVAGVTHGAAVLCRTATHSVQSALISARYTQLLTVRGSLNIGTTT